MSSYGSKALDEAMVKARSDFETRERRYALLQAASEIYSHELLYININDKGEMLVVRQCVTAAELLLAEIESREPKPEPAPEVTGEPV